MSFSLSTAFSPLELCHYLFPLSHLALFLISFFLPRLFNSTLWFLRVGMCWSYSFSIFDSGTQIPELNMINSLYSEQNSLHHRNFWGWKLYLLLVYDLPFSHSVVSNSLWPHGPQHARAPCPSPTPRVYSNSCPLSQWCHPTILYSLVLFSSCLQSFPASGSFQISQFFTSGGQSIGVSASASVLPMNTQDWSPLGWTG